ncbi:uncharacterized protein GIQ15_06157 [Arthroderma uncinatum]|uniref:uncharacterized protein n=1 Tax=Arthroderma uncinatum TaxID=74035 RepID=UPI00144AE237|nr:uncharacterized protein GIQ15_06157 [Arthroderma uncinatum]KAF3480810.1 hypothetical protein GIQ15_06157 [Arthroderma uncinatum]
MSNDASFNASNSWTSFSAHGTSSNSATSTVRSRNRRLIQSHDDSDDDGLGAGYAGVGSQRSQRSVRPSLSNGGVSSSGTASPIPSKRLPRMAGGQMNQERESPLRGSGFGGMREDTSGGKAAGFATDFLESPWSSLQGFASNVIGTGSALISGGVSSNGQGRGKLSGAKSPGRVVGGGAPKGRPQIPTSWGPTGSIIGDPNPDAQKERQALVQAKKREALLQANGDNFPDIWGNYKRRDSGDGFERSTPTSTPGKEDGDALVYIHIVQSNDTLTGVSIRYGCQLAVLRKSNGFWPSDSIQSRKTIVLPVESCTLKGLPVPSDEARKHTDDASGDSLDHGTSSLVPDSDITGTCDFGNGVNTSRPDGDYFNSPRTENETGSDPPWKHHSWVKLDGFPSPVEIGRLPRKSLGFFPRARRKSQLRLTPYSDNPGSLSSSMQDSFVSEVHSTPPRGPRDSTSAPRSSRDGSTSGTGSPRYSASRPRRRRSIALSGPGGVGTLENAIYPGPPIDKFTTFVNSHLPTLTVKPATTYTTPTLASLHNQERTSFDSADSAVFSSSSAAGLENVGGAIEGWFRKVATRAKAGINEIQQQQPLNQQFANLGLAGASGDLIELNDAPEITRTQHSPTIVLDGASSTQATSSSFADPAVMRRSAYNNSSSPAASNKNSLRGSLPFADGADRFKGD